MTLGEWFQRLLSQAIYFYYFLVFVALLVWLVIPNGIHHKDWSENEEKTFLISKQNEQIISYKKTYSTAIQAVDGLESRDEWYGPPGVAILDPGPHKVYASCRWNFLGQGIGHSFVQLKHDFKVNAIYILKSRFIDRNKIFFNDCGVYIEEIRAEDMQLISNLQMDILRTYGIE